MFDLGDFTRQMNTLKTVPVSVARILVKNGTDAINHAIQVAASKNLPGGSDRAIVQGKMQWHTNTLAPTVLDPNSTYGSGDDLKHWVTQAFIESNAADEGAAWIDDTANSMWAAIKEAVAALPAEVKAATVATTGYVGDLVHSAASSLVENVTGGIPLWAIVAGGAAVIGIAGFAAYKILQGPTGGAIVGAYTGRRK